MIVLGLGLKFIRNPGIKNISGTINYLIKDIEAAFEKYIWPKSNVMTRAQDDIMAKTFSCIKREILKIEVVPPRLNFPQRLRIALTSLREDLNIIIVKADKGDTVVVLNSAHYYSLAAKHLADNRTYELLETLIPPRKLSGGITNTSKDVLVMKL